MADVRNHICAQLERLSDEDISPEDLKKEVSRGKAISELSKQFIESAKVEVAYLKAIGADGSEAGVFEHKQIGNKK